MKLRFLALAAALLCLFSCLTGCGAKRQTKELDKSTVGIDVARYQGNIDWSQAAASGIDFAIVRLGYRSMSDGAIVEDRTARYNLQEASKAGVALGAYFFSTAVSKEEAEEEARWVADLLAKYPITYPVAYDCEGYLDADSRQQGMSAQERTDVALAFLKAIEKLGYEGMFYASKNALESENHWLTEKIQKKYKIWVAQYPDLPYPATPKTSYRGQHHIWQYSMEGSVPGISQSVDLNIAYFGYNGIEPPKDPVPPEEVGPDPEALMAFREANESVTAKDEINLRSIPSQDTDSIVLTKLKNGEIAQRIAVSDSGWSKLLWNGNIYYAVSSYLTTDLGYDPENPTREDPDGIQTQFTPVSEQVTAKEVVNLRALPSVDHADAEILAQLKNGDIATRVGISDNGWSKLTYNGTTCYAVSSYLTLAGQESTAPEPDTGIQTQFEPMDDLVTAKVEVNLRTLPSVEDPNCVIVVLLKNGEVVKRTGINHDLGWSRVEYEGQTLYCVSSYLTAAE